MFKKSIQGMLAVSVLALGLPVAAYAMGHGEHCTMHKKARHHGGMYSELNLSDAQRSEIQTIMQAQREETRQAIFKVLTPEQQAKAQAMHEQRQEKRNARKGQQQPGNLTPGDAS